MIGRTIGRFRVTALLGKGGMASVWRAHDELLERDVALKILEEPLAQVPDSRRRFRGEATTASRLDHPGIVAVYDSGESDGCTWIAMALIEGQTLSERLRQSLVPIRDVVNLAIAVGDALGYAHESGVIHRDVTSRNVMLSRDGRIFILDFGLALAKDGSRISSSGTTVGTVSYMAPEVLSGARANPRSDLFGLGVVLYEALTGALPFKSESHAGAAFAALHQTPRPPSELRPEIPPELDDAVLRCIARDPAARFERAADLIAELRRIRTRIEGAASSATPAAVGSTTGAAADPASEARSPRSGIADHLASGAGPIYLVVPLFSSLDDHETPETSPGDLAPALTTTVAAGLAQLQRVHVVRAEATPDGDSPAALRKFARSAGAQLVLLGTVRRSGTRFRVTVSLLDPEASAQIAGDTLEGSTFDVFELEDRLLASVRKMLARDAADSGAVTREIPRDPAAAEHFQQAMRYLERHDQESSVDAAIAILERLIASEGETAGYQAALARAGLFKYDLTKQRSWESRAIAAGARAAGLSPEAPETLLAIGDLHRVAGRFVEAEAAYRGVLAQRPVQFEAMLGLARVLDARGLGEDAEEGFLEVVRRNPADWRGHSSLGRFYFSRGEYAKAAEAWSQVLRLVPDSARGARNLGSAYFHTDRFEDAVRAYQRSLALEPDAVAFTNLGTALFLQQRLAEAVEAFEKAAALTPADPVMWGNLGNALRLVPGREADARLALERAVGVMRDRLTRDTRDREAWGRLAGWLSNLGQIEAALQALDTALERSPDDVPTMVRAAHVHLVAGHRADCLGWLKKAIDHGYGRGTLIRDPEFAVLRESEEFRRILDCTQAHPRQEGPQREGNHRD